jgi:hypothetical protein
MYISGHSQILQQSIKELSIDWKGINFEYVTNELLNKGLKYPDLPCGSFQFKDKKLKVTKELCGLVKIVDDIVIKPELFSIAYTSHNGIFSIWHSMTFDPNKTVKEVRDEIVDHILILARLSLKDTNISRDELVPNIFWLGMVLHTIMDSYSPAHLLRKNTWDIDYNRLIKTYLPTNKIEVDKGMKEHLALVDELKARIQPIAYKIDDSDEQDLDDVVQQIANDYKITKKTQIKQLSVLAKFFYFHINKLTSFDQQRSVILEKGKTTRVSKSKHPIVNFYYYPSQKGVFHKKYDLIYYCKQFGLYEECMNDIRFVLKMYFNVISNPRGYTEAQVNKFLTNLQIFLIKKPFAIVPSCEDFFSGLDIEQYQKKVKDL